VMKYFYRSKRAFGYAALLVACALTVLWMRSFQVYNRADFAIGTTQFRLFSFQGDLYFLCCKDHAFTTYWGSRNVSKPLEQRKISSQLQAQLQEARQLLGGWTVPYWSFVLPVTALAAWCLLTKQRGDNRLPRKGRAH
jgi:hypothetical protein